MARYGQAFKDRAVARMLPPESAAPQVVSREIGVGVDTLERWRAESLARPAKERVWTAAARLEAVITTAALGGEVDVPTLDGKATIDIPEGTQHGKTFRLRGRGIKGVRSSYPGDLYAHIAVETPVKLTEHQRRLLRELDESLKKNGNKHSPNEKGWFEKARDFFS